MVAFTFSAVPTSNLHLLEWSLWQDVPSWLVHRYTVHDIQWSFTPFLVQEEVETCQLMAATFCFDTIFIFLISNPLISKSDQHIKFCLVIISGFVKLRTWSHEMNLLDILSTSPHYFCWKWIGQQMRIQILILGFKGLKWKQVNMSQSEH